MNEAAMQGLKSRPRRECAKYQIQLLLPANYYLPRSIGSRWPFHSENSRLLSLSVNPTIALIISHRSIVLNCWVSLI